MDRSNERIHRIRRHVAYASSQGVGMARVAFGQANTNKELLEAIEKAAFAYHPEGSTISVAIGANTNLDLIVPALDTFKNMKLAASSSPASHNSIASEEELAETFQFFFQDSAAGERPIVSPTLYKSVLAAAQAVPDKKLFIGGNAALMANVMAKEGVKVLLGGPVGMQLQKLLSQPNLSFATQPTKEIEEDVHLILEYTKGEKWGEAAASRSNRFIVNAGENEGISKMLGFQALIDKLATNGMDAFRADLLVVSGCNILEGQNAAFRSQRLATVASQMQRVRQQDIPVHLEVASVGDPNFLREMMDLLLPISDSVGFNEQELCDVYSAVSPTQMSAQMYADVSARTVKNVPVIAQVTKAMHYLLSVGGRRGGGMGALKRAHFHCLAYHQVGERLPRQAVAPSKTDFGHPVAAVARGSLAATTIASGMSVAELTSSDIDLIVPTEFVAVEGQPSHRVTADSPVCSWEVGGGDGDEWFYRFTLVPVLVCKQPKKTVGLGDSISATALAYSL